MLYGVLALSYSTILYPPRLNMETAFGSVQLQLNSVNGFGECIYIHAAYNPYKPHLNIKTSSVFGKIDIQVRNL
jgi:hypothetical protein